MFNLMRKELLSQNIFTVASAFIWFIPLTQFFTNGAPITHVVLLIVLSVWVPFCAAYYEQPTLENSLPVTRKQLVQAKYLSCLMWFIPAATIVVTYVILFENFAPFSSRLMTWEDLLLALAGVYLLLSIFYPLYYLAGVMIASALTAAAAVMISIGTQMVLNIYHNPSMSSLNEFVEAVSANPTLFIMLLAAIVLVITILSYLLSVWIYKKKDILH
jgi:ABC-type transport system involved in multi-copper enzyme maturation permease subunit